ncbi:hypothetical protein OBBRIDRAFT_735850, partial [Obba rivulosa]
NREELFNLRHAKARNVIERIFGVLKCRFKVLMLCTEFRDFDIQRRIPIALAAVHNFIRKYDQLDIHNENSTDNSDREELSNLVTLNNFHSLSYTGELATEIHSKDQAERTRAKERRDNIAQRMWDAYQAEMTDSQADDDTRN